MPPAGYIMEKEDGMGMRSEPGIRASKAERVKAYLLNTLLPLPDGAKLPGIRHIMAETGAGQLTVCRVLRSLKEEGRLVILPRQGIRRSGQASRADEIRLLHTQVLNPDGFFSILFRKLTACAEEFGRKIVPENITNRPVEEVMEELTSQGVSRCIICDAKTPDLALFLKNRMKVCPELLPRHPDQVTTELRDSAEMTVIQMTYLFNHGYRRIGYLHYGGEDTFCYPVQVRRLMDYYRLMAENGLRVNPGWVFHCSENNDNVETGMTRIMDSDPRPEALIVPGGNLGRVYAFCRKHGIRIGRDLGLFGCDDTHEELTPEPTVVCNDPAEIAESFWRMFLALERGEKVESRRTELLIRTGRTLPSKLPGTP